MTTTWRINHPTLKMRVAKFFGDLLHTPAPPPLGGWTDTLPEAFGALNAKGEVEIIGYKGDWYFTRKPSLRTRVHNWFVGIYNRQLDGYSDTPPPKTHKCEYSDPNQCAWPGHRKARYPDENEIDEATLREGYWHP